MKCLITLFYCMCFCGISFIANAQDASDPSENSSEQFLERHPIYDYTDTLRSTDTIPDYSSKATKLKISGTIYESDGVTPAKDVILFIEQADEDGDFDLREQNNKRYVHHRGWIKTDANGRYTFYTFVPGNDRRYNQLQQLFPTVKQAENPVYELESFLFDDDPLLSKLCRKRITKKGDPTRILKPKAVDGMLVVEKDIILGSGLEVSK